MLVEKDNGIKNQLKLKGNCCIVRLKRRELTLSQCLKYLTFK